MSGKKSIKTNAAKRMANLFIEHMEEKLTPLQAKKFLRDLGKFSKQHRR